MRLDNPLAGALRITSPYGSRSSGNHFGVDFGAATGIPVFASADGAVLNSFESDSYGNRIILSHAEGYITTYNHLDVRIAQKGEEVKRGDIIGTVGNTGHSFGSHLHFELKINGEFVDPMLHLNNASLDLSSAIWVGAMAVGFALMAFGISRL